ncbi:hypothetical protein FQZ97_846900 [compost metagenome]
MQGVAGLVGVGEQALHRRGIPQEHHRRAAGALGEFQYQALLPVADLVGRQPAVALAIAGGTDLDPRAPLRLLALIDVEHRESRDLCAISRCAGLVGETRPGFAQHALEQGLLALHEQRALSAVADHHGIIRRLSIVRCRHRGVAIGIRLRLADVGLSGVRRRRIRAQEPVTGPAHHAEQHQGEQHQPGCAR